MSKSFIVTFALAIALGTVPQAALAQTSDDNTAAPMATATANPMATDQSMGGVATPAPATSTTETTTPGGGGNGIWGLIGLVGLLGLFGARRSTTTTITGPR